MNLTQFQEESKRTMPFNGEPKNNIEYENLLGNYALGLIGESVELLEAYEQDLTLPGAIDNLLKEVGDITHYAVGIAALFRLKLPDEFEYPLNDIDQLISSLLSNAKTVSEYAKKHIYHRHNEPFDYQSLLDIFATLNKISKLFGYSYGEVMQMNINKLKTRYPDRFNTVDSIARKDVQG